MRLSPGSSRRLMRVLALVLLLACSALALGACGDSDESPQEEAIENVCDARDDIGEQVDRLSSLTLTTATATEVGDSLQAIRADLTTIADQRAELSSERRQEVEQATRAFTDQLSDIAGSLGTDLSLSAARRQLSAALDQLASAYRASLAQVSCD